MCVWGGIFRQDSGWFSTTSTSVFCFFLFLIIIPISFSLSTSLSPSSNLISSNTWVSFRAESMFEGKNGARHRSRERPVLIVSWFGVCVFVRHLLLAHFSQMEPPPQKKKKKKTDKTSSFIKAINTNYWRDMKTASFTLFPPSYGEDSWAFWVWRIMWWLMIGFVCLTRRQQTVTPSHKTEM